MPSNSLLSAPPHGVDAAVKRLGANLRTARLRRSLTVAEAAEKIGTGPRAVMDAEKGRPAASIATYVALLWAYGLLDQFDEIADPARDERGRTLALAHERKRARKGGGLSDDF